MESVSGKVVFITGGANGIGAAVGRRLHDKGAKVVLTDVDEAALHDIAADLNGDSVLTLTADVRDLTAMEGAVSRAVDRFGGIDVVMANAGIATFGSVLHVDPEAFNTLININILGVFHTVRAALPSVIERRGYVLIVSSGAAYLAVAGMAPYNTSKAGVEHFANALRLEVANRGVAVGSAHMSWIDTSPVRESKAELASAREMIDSLPGLLGKSTSVEKCAAVFVKGIEGRKSHINCPSWVGLFRWLKPLLSSPVVERQSIKLAADSLPKVDAEVAALDRSLSAHPSAREAGLGVIRQSVGLIAAVALLVAMTGCRSNEQKGQPSTAAPTSAAVTPRQAPRDREGRLHLWLPDRRQLPRPVRLLRRQAGSGVQGRLEPDS